MSTTNPRNNELLHGIRRAIGFLNEASEHILNGRPLLATEAAIAANAAIAGVYIALEIQTRKDR